VTATKDGWQSSEKTVFFDSPKRRIDLSIRPVVEDE
jgi:hypothetical protein